MENQPPSNVPASNPEGTTPLDDASPAVPQPTETEASVPPPFALPESRETEEGAKPGGRGPVATFFIGVLLVFVGAGSLVVSSGPRGGLLLVGALFFGAVLIFRAIVAHREARAAGAPPLTTPLKAVAAIALVASVAFAGYAGFRQLETVGLTETKGSCWQSGDGDELFLVPCSQDHDYVVVEETTSPDSCPATSDGYVYSEKGAVLCLQPA